MQREGRYPMRSMVGRCELYTAFRPGLRPGGGLVGARGRNSHRANNAQPPLTWEVDNALQPRAEAREKQYAAVSGGDVAQRGGEVTRGRSMGKRASGAGGAKPRAVRGGRSERYEERRAERGTRGQYIEAWSDDAARAVLAGLRAECEETQRSIGECTTEVLGSEERVGQFINAHCTRLPRAGKELARAIMLANMQKIDKSVAGRATGEVPRRGCGGSCDPCARVGEPVER